MELASSNRPISPLALYQLIENVCRREPKFDHFRDTPLSPEMAGAIKALAAERDWDLSYRPGRDGRRIRLAGIGRIDSGHLRPSTNARFGIDLRDPTIDRRIVELCLAIPEEHFLRDGRESAVFRDAMAGVLPSWLLKQRHRGLQSADWYEGVVAAREELAEHVERLARSKLASRALNIEWLRGAVTELPDPGTPPDILADGNWGSLQGERDGTTLLRGMSVGHFILRTEGSNQ
jgi:asparagine synthase (glutamine-hydrolysing)